jgi:hypothetical protein
MDFLDSGTENEAELTKYGPILISAGTSRSANNLKRCEINVSTKRIGFNLYII